MAVALLATLLLSTYASVCLAAVGTADATANPIRKIVSLMQDMQKEIDAEGAKEKQLYEKFMCFCSGNSGQMNQKVSDGQAKIDELSSSVEEETAEQAQLKQDLVQHASDRDQAKQDLEKAAGLRNKEQADAQASLADQQTNLAGVSSAIPALESGMNGASFAQLPDTRRLRQLMESSQYTNSYDRNLVTSFLDQTGDYVPASGQIVGILKNMQDQMTASIKEAKEDEARSAEGFEQLKVAKEQEVGVAQKMIETKTTRAGELAVSIVQNQDALEDTKEEVKETQKFLQTLAKECGGKEKEWAVRSKMRAEEISAISDAIGILNDDDALDVFKKAVPSALVQQNQPEFGFLQAKENGRMQVHQAAALLQSAAQIYRSSRLDLIAYAMRTKLRLGVKGAQHSDFAEIQKMIGDMIVLQKKEQKNDEKHVEFCKSEFRTSEGEQKEKQKGVAQLGAAMDEMKSEIESIEADLKTLADSIQGLDKAVAEATEQRKEEHAQYVQDAQLTQTAIQLVGKAKNRLLKFYNPSLHKPESTPAPESSLLSDLSLLEVIHAHTHLRAEKHMNKQMLKQPTPPETFGAYEKKGQKSGGVMGLMDMIVKEMESASQEAQHDEKNAQKEYTELMEESKEGREQDTKSITTKESAKAQLGGRLTDAREKQALTMDEVEHIHGVISDLHASCDFIMENFDIRKEARNQEIESLTNAKAMLAGANFGF